MSAFYQSTPAFPTRKTQDGEQLYNTTVHFTFNPAGYSPDGSNLELAYSPDGVFDHGLALGKLGDCGMHIRSGDTILKNHVWLTWWDLDPENPTSTLGKYNARSFPISAEQMVAMGQALVAMGTAELARQAMDERDRISAAVDNIHNLARQQNLDEAGAKELRVRVQKELTQRVR